MEPRKERPYAEDSENTPSSVEREAPKRDEDKSKYELMLALLGRHSVGGKSRLK